MTASAPIIQRPNSGRGMALRGNQQAMLLLMAAVFCVAIAIMLARADNASGSDTLAEGAVVTVAGLSILYLLVRLGSAAAFAAFIVAEVFSGYAGQIGLPISPDRVLTLVALIYLTVEWAQGKLPVRIRWAPVHAAMVLSLGYATVSAIAVGSIQHSEGFFALLDRFGALPFLMFTLAPVVFATAKQRSILLAFLVVLGLYLGLTTLFEGIGANSLVFPRYITNPNVGIHYGRARGPFAEAAANGLALVQCAAMCLVAFRLWSARWTRLAALLIAALCLLGTVFTLTRAVWLGTAISLIVPMLLVRDLRKYLLPFAAAATLGVAILIAVVPGLRTDIDHRTGGRTAQQSVWDRLNTNSAAIRIGELHPVTGIGWEEFRTKGGTYQEQARTYPITTGDIEVHNVLLSHVAELGLPGAALWLITLILAMVPALLRPTSPEMRLWRIGFIAILVDWLIISNATPMPYAFCNMLVWLIAGLVYGCAGPKGPLSSRGSSSLA